MANVVSTVALNMSALNFYRITSGYFTDNFYNDVNTLQNGYYYNDILEVIWTSSANYYSSIFGGQNINISPLGNVNNGTVTGYSEAIFTGNDWVPYFSVLNISVDATTLYNAFLTPDETDDLSIIATALSGNDLLIGSQESDVLYGFGGNDTVAPGMGNDIVYGFSGIDTARYDVFRSAVSLTENSDGSFQLTGGAIGSDLLNGIERIDLLDGDFVFDVTGSQSDLVYRLYQAAFARTPDEGGFRYWAYAVDQWGISPLALAREFRVATEFIQKYGANVSDYDYTYNMYRNVLGREPDIGGINYWTSQVTNLIVSRDQLLIEFAESAENKTLTNASTEFGYWVI